MGIHTDNSYLRPVLSMNFQSILQLMLWRSITLYPWDIENVAEIRLCPTHLFGISGMIKLANKNGKRE